MTNYQKLTERESEVKELLLQGLTTKEIADSLNISMATAKTHICNVLNKLDVESKVQLIVLECENLKKMYEDYVDNNLIITFKPNKYYTEQQKYIINFLENYVKTTCMLCIDRNSLIHGLGLKDINKPLSDLNKRFREINNTDKNLIWYDRLSECYVLASVDKWMQYFKLQ